MKKIKKYMAAVIFFIFCIGLSSCSTNEKEESSTFNPEQEEWDSEELEENLIADFSADNADISEAYVYDCEMGIMSVEQMKEIFFYSDNSQIDVTERYYEPEEPKFGFLYMLTTENALEILSSYFTRTGKTYEADFYKNFLSCDEDAWDENSRPDKLGTGEELVFLSKGEIETEIMVREKPCL